MKLIVEMDMPQACRWYEDGTKKRCPIAEWGGACAVTKLFEPFDDNRPSWCPICGVLPNEHGDIVDINLVGVNYCDEIEYDNNAVILAAERKDDGTTAD